MAMNPMAQFRIEPLVPLHIGRYDVSFTNQALWMFIVIGAASLFLTIAATSRSLVPSRIQSVAEIFYEFVTDMIRAAAGDAGLRFFAFIFTIFVFVLVANVLGLIPGSFTVTSHIAITFALAAVVILTVIITGFLTHGIGFLKLFVPKAPIYLLFLLVPIEIISFLTRPISLSVRLFANMLAGHTMLVVFAGFTVALGLLGFLPLSFNVFLFAIEVVINFLQAYVFAILTCLYLSDSIHLH